MDPEKPATEPPEETPSEKIRRGRPSLGTETREIIYRGASINQLAEIFGIRDETVARRIAGVEPSGTGKNGILIYRVADVAPRLVQIPITQAMIEERIIRMRPTELPPALQKGYWDGALARHRYGQLVGDLWPTEEVLAVASTVFQGLREALLLLPDKLKGEIDLTEAQMSDVQRVVDTLIEGLREQLITNLRARAGGANGHSHGQAGQA